MATLISIQVTPITPNILIAQTQQFIATGTYSDSTTQDLTTSVSWASSNTAIATISNASTAYGIATGVSAGSVNITASLNSISSNTTMSVSNATLTAIIALITAGAIKIDGVIAELTRNSYYQSYVNYLNTEQYVPILNYNIDNTVLNINNTTNLSFIYNDILANDWVCLNTV